MPWFMTEYRALGPRPSQRQRLSHVGNYGGYVWASSWRQALARCRARGIGEWLIGRPSRVSGPAREAGRGRAPYLSPSQMLRKRWAWTQKRRLQLIHATVFLSFLLSQCKRGRTRLAHHQMLLGDEGLLHQVVHCMSLGRPRRHDMARTLARFERLVPGYVAGGAP